ncbi:hypothetical protein AMIS_59940 [Actinoplanes missouriensis 431]|uniref:Uncharacterized protein n=1 Tax=Actinoplanes missouriensis (strain ATCC 14538 / DSM 43046 / CBS 188.64 / JCM 3121 / NBRC 102363 / NCIMB 12654 / NRRL B-3342 / UNCC 431) TaxID=512565 RepID=I0HDX7_ACTM4|nr:hypothetical protein [Actinoplanes missouriensis]BAL91214.1 hypothetical protein AMIS_59940 [Actinoplanes missouriensis 431]
MPRTWTHIGRLWTNGEPFLAIDGAHRGAWDTDEDGADDFERILDMGEETSLTVGDGRAVLVGGDGVVRDDSWIEVFVSGDEGILAVVQAGGPDYRAALAAALRYPDGDDREGDILPVDSGELAIFSAASDGAGEYATPLLPPRPGPVPAKHGWPLSDIHPGLLIPTGAVRAYRTRIRLFTRIGDDVCFARWLLVPRD